MGWKYFFQNSKSTKKDLDYLLKREFLKFLIKPVYIIRSFRRIYFFLYFQDLPKQ